MAFLGRKRFKITALGGVDEVGEKNCILLAYGNDGILLDCGQKVPSSQDFEGQDYSPNFEKIARDVKIHAVLVTHGHLDHIGGLEKLFSIPKHSSAPVVASEFTLRVIHNKVFSGRFGAFRGAPDAVMEAGPFSISRFPVLHSIPGSAGFVVALQDGKGGTVSGAKLVYTGDIKMPGDQKAFQMNPERAERYMRYWGAFETIKQRLGERPDYLIQDATNINEEGYAGIEEEVYPALRGIISGNPRGRVYIALISSNAARIRNIISVAKRLERRVYVAGAAIMEFLHIADIDGWYALDNSSAQFLPRNAIIITTGSQAEENSFLDRLAMGSLQYPLDINSEDLLAISSDTIPKEQIQERFQVMAARLREMFGLIYLTHDTPHIEGNSGGKIRRAGNLHVSGHGKQGDVAQILEELKPRTVIPFHAEEARRAKLGEFAEGLVAAGALLLEKEKSTDLR